MLFSIVVPVYGVEKYIHKCVDSILNQTYKDFELILVDDGSKDNCPKILDGYAEKDSRIKVVHKENGGLVSARKAGVKVATGDYIVSVDGDDWVKENYLEVFANIAQNNDVDMMCCGYIKAYEKENLNRPLRFNEGYYSYQQIKEQIFPRLIENEYAESFPPSVCFKVVKREIMNNALQHIDNRVVVGEDSLCTCLIFSVVKNVYICKECLYYYRQNDLSITKTKKAQDMQTPMIRYSTIQKVAEKECAYDFSEQIYRATVHSLFNAVVSQFNREEKKIAIKRDINNIINDKYYSTAINRCKFKGVKPRLMRIALKYKLFFLMKIYCRKKWKTK